MNHTLGSLRLSSLGSSRELGAKLGVSHETARKLQSGSTRPTARMRTRIRDTFGIPPEAFDRPAPAPERPAPDLSPVVAGVADSAPPDGSAIVELREQRDRLKAVLADPGTSDRVRVDTERLLTGCLKAIGVVERAYVSGYHAETEVIIDKIVDAVQQLRVDEKLRSQIAQAIIDAVHPMPEAA